jgi:uncharacterized membrane protein YeiH
VIDTGALLLTLDLVGVFVFAVSGALLAVQRRLDVFGVAILATAASIGGGLARDVLLGALPPAAFTDVRYLVVPLVAAGVVFVAHPEIVRLAGPVRVFDAAGLALFTVAGTLKALDAGLGPLQACALGVLTGVGGGVLRDVLVREVPAVLVREVYAMAALAGAVVVAVGERLGGDRTVVALAGAAVVFGLRVASVWRRWHAPVSPRPPTEEPSAG